MRKHLSGLQQVRAQVLPLLVDMIPSDEMKSFTSLRSLACGSGSKCYWLMTKLPAATTRTEKELPTTNAVNRDIGTNKLHLLNY